MYRNPAVQPAKLTNQRATITAIDLTTGVAMARTALGKEISLRLDRRPKGSAAPAIGEIWTITRQGYVYVLDDLLTAPAPPVITGSRTGADPLALSLLDALTQLGHVQDGTTA